MIPTYLQGKSAVDICGEMSKKFYKDKSESLDSYIKFLEGCLLLAVKDALCNCGEVKELIEHGEYLAQQRAIVFLNMVLPCEEKDVFK